ncbi:MAG: hypothetical protein N2246_09045, partial [Candidatus Sumerlaeia bacterium]|nr:hypothetical protein [Candidatus Sumerlaeia bacterium]
MPRDIQVLVLTLLILLALFFGSLFLIQPIFFQFIHFDKDMYEGLAEHYLSQKNYPRAEFYLKKLTTQSYVPYRIYFKLAELYKEWEKPDLQYQNLIQGTLLSYRMNVPFVPPKEVYLAILNYELRNELIAQAIETMVTFINSYPLEYKLLEAECIKLYRAGFKQTMDAYIQFLIRQQYYAPALQLLARRFPRTAEDIYAEFLCLRDSDTSETIKQELLWQAIMEDSPPLQLLLNIEQFTTDSQLILLAEQQFQQTYQPLAHTLPEPGKHFIPLNAFKIHYDYTFELPQTSRVELAFLLRSTKVLDIAGILYISIKKENDPAEIVRLIYVDAGEWSWYVMPVELSAGRYQLTFRLGNNLYLENKFARAIFM